jgi:hypothetical protein
LSSGPAAILCEGEGCLRYRHEPGTLLVAVNNAIRLEGVVPHGWAVQDDISRYAGLVPVIYPETVLLAGSFANAPGWWPGAWQELGTEAAVLELLEREIVYSHAVPTVVVAALWAVRAGYDPVTLFACDMRGSGSPLTEAWAPYKPYDTSWDDRWDRERALLAEVCAAWPAVRVAA